MKPIFLLLSFIIIIAIIMMADGLTTAVLCISVLTNFFSISNQLGSLKAECNIDRFTNRSIFSAILPAAKPAITEPINEKNYMKSYAENSGKYDIDDRQIVSSKFRSSRDKRAIAGSLTNKYKHGKELYTEDCEESDMRDWWGN